ncbi:hypothetical protein ACFE04_002109 [Oxalis oulophora]
MVKKVKWFSSVKRAFSPDSKKKKQQQLQTLEEPTYVASTSSSIYVERVTDPPPAPLPEPEEVAITAVEDEQNDNENSAAIASAAAAVEVEREATRIASASRFAGKSKEEVAAIRIQTAFRGYLARRALRALRGLNRLKALLEGPVVKRQASSTLRCMQTLSRVQTQIRTRRIRMAEENQALQKQLLQKHAKELASLEMGDDWDDSLQSKEQIEASLLSKYEASTRRERAMAYAFTHQQNGKNTSRYVNPMFMDPRNPTWGWSWLERWMAARPWESRCTTDKELNNDRMSVKSVVEGEISKSYARHQFNSSKPSPTSSQKPSRATSPRSPLTPSKPAFSAGNNRRSKPASPRGSVKGLDDDTKSVTSMMSSKNRRHSIAGSSVRDDEIQSGSLPSYMVPTQSARAKSRLQSPAEGAEENGTPEKELPTSAKKRLSYPASPAKPPRRHSGPPRVSSSVFADDKLKNGGIS